MTDFTVTAVHARIGDEAWRALSRNETTPARRATAGGDGLDTLIRMFLLHDDVPAARVPELEKYVSLGLVTVDGDTARAEAELRPYGDDDHDWWVVCDLTPGFDGHHTPMRPDFVLGISEASTSLAQLTHRRPVVSVLDLGTGCGVQALHASTHARHVVATDVNARAIEFTRLAAELNGVEIDVREGSFYEPVAGERFDLITTNPPFVVSPPEGDRLVYRETGFALDGVVQHVVQGAVDHLEPGGWCQILAAWVQREGESWENRLRSWIEPTGLDAFVVRRELADLPSYTEIWLADAGLRGDPAYVERYDAWLTWFAEHEVEAMNFGWINLRRADRATPAVRIEHHDGLVRQPVGPAIVAWGDAVDALEGRDPLAVAWSIAPGVVQDTVGEVGAEDPARIVVRQETGLCRRRQVDTVTAALLGACDGDLTAGQILDAVSQLLGEDSATVRETYRSVVTDLVLEGFLAA